MIAFDANVLLRLLLDDGAKPSRGSRVKAEITITVGSGTRTAQCANVLKRFDDDRKGFVQRTVAHVAVLPP